MKRTLGSLLLLVVSLACAVALGEGAARLVLEEVDYLQPELAPHPVLRYAIVPGTGAHDEWGFRNARVPERVEILAVGDSQTYGISAPASESWPAWLGRLSGRSVYNLSLGGYGPPDYRYLLEEYGLDLAPQVAVIGFYFGNDLPRAADVAKGRNPPSEVLPGERDERAFAGLRRWAAQHSVLYQVAKYRLPALTDALRRREAAADGGAIALDHPVVQTYFEPTHRFAVLDQSRSANRRGLDATLATFVEIEAACAARAVACIYLLIPTKESVYWDLARDRLDEAGREEVGRVVREEVRVRERMITFLEERGLAWVDPLPALRAAAAHRALYPANADGHPNGDGYRVIAHTVYERLASLPERSG